MVVSAKIFSGTSQSHILTNIHANVVLRYRIHKYIHTYTHIESYINQFALSAVRRVTRYLDARRKGSVQLSFDLGQNHCEFHPFPGNHAADLRN